MLIAFGILCFFHGFLVILLGALAFISCWYIQLWASHLFAPDRKPLWLALGLCAVWLGLSIAAGVVSSGLGIVIWQLLAGFLAAVGGRRTLAGRQMMSEIIGLRRYLKSLTRDQLQSICKQNPDYFHQMMPSAMALGVDRRFAKRFGNMPVEQCPYISVGADSTLRAVQWRGLMRRVLAGMNTRGQASYWKRFLSAIEAFRK